MLNFYLSLIDDSEDKNKFEYLFLKYEQQLFYIANKIVKDTGLAEDAVQFTFFNLAKEFKKVSRLDENIIKSRLYIMVKNASINIKKKKNNIRKYLLKTTNNPYIKLRLILKVWLIQNLDMKN